MKRLLKPLFVGIVVMAALSAGALYLIGSDKTVASKLGILSNVVSILNAVLLFGISLFAYQKFNASQQTADKKADKVFGLIEYLQEIRIILSYQESATSGQSYNIRPVVDKDAAKSINKTIFKDEKDQQGNAHYFDESVIKVYQDLVVIAEDMFLPKRIAEKIKEAFDMESMFALDGKPYKDVNYKEIVVHTRKTPNSNFSLIDSILEEHNSMPDKVVVSFNNKPVNADELIKNLNLIYKEARSWIKENSPYVISDLNI